MNKINTYCVTSPEAVGCSFLDWSILWLSGQKKVFSVDRSSWHDICQDPLQTHPTVNAHAHTRNHKSGWQRNQSCVPIIKSHSNHSLTSLYPFPLYIDDCCRALDFEISDLSQSEKFDMVMAYQKQDYTNMLNWLHTEQNVPVVYVAFDPSVRGYTWTYRALDRMLTSCQKPSNVKDLYQEQQDVFFNQSQHRWVDLGLTQIWDIRERMALDIRPFSQLWAENLVLTHNHHWVNCQDLWFDTERTVRDIMSWLGLDIVQSKLLHWLPVMRRWQQIHNDNLKFPRQLSKILTSIVHGMPHDLSDLTFQQEVIVQHCLIYQYNLNLRTWNLEKFPRCAKLLHSLLEPNIHTVQKIYQ